MSRYRTYWVYLTGGDSPRINAYPDEHDYLKAVASWRVTAASTYEAIGLVALCLHGRRSHPDVKDLRQSEQERTP